VTKRELLLSIAQSCVSFGEGSDFSFRDVIVESGNEEGFENHYGLSYPGDDASEKMLEKYDADNETAREHLQSDVLGLLEELKSKPTWSTKRPTEDGLYWVRSPDDPEPTVVKITLKHIDGSSTIFPIEMISSDNIFGWEEYENCEWCPAIPPV
jgi:hypothetical protein